MLMLPTLASASGFANETLHYTITYKWGLIHKDAAKATLNLRNSGDHYNIYVYAKTLPWADRVFEVRDTLRSTVLKNGFKVKNYQKITHEGKKYGKDQIDFSYAGTVVKGSVSRWREGKDGKVSTSKATLTGKSPSFDMLSVFYYLRLLDFESMKKGHVYNVTIFSGTKTETLSIKSEGIETIKLRDKSKAQAWHLKFTFTRDGKKKSSDDMSAWISTTPQHIPLYLVGKLPVGEVRVYYDN